MNVLQRPSDDDTTPPPECTRRQPQDDQEVITVKASPSDIELIWTAIHEAMTADTERPTDERRADALVAIADAYLASRPADRSGADRTQVIVHEHRDENGSITDAHLDDGTPISEAERRRISCDAATLTVTIGHRDEPEVGRRSSGVSAGLRRRLAERDDNQCQWPGCGGQHHLHAHHVVHRADGGATVLDNLALLCGHHHRVLHQAGYELRRGENRWQAIRPDGSEVDHRPVVITIPDAARRTAVPHPETIKSNWDGSDLDLAQLEPLNDRPVRGAERSVTERSAER